MAEAGLDYTICVGESQTLTASGGVTYQWGSSLSLSTLNTANTVATPTSDEQFFVTITTPEGCEATDSCYVFVQQTIYGFSHKSVALKTAHQKLVLLHIFHLTRSDDVLRIAL
jgi:hypothetical protein